MADTLSLAERKAIASGAEEAAAALTDEPLLTVAELSDMSLNEIEQYLRRMGVEVDLERIELEVRQTLGPDVLRMDRGQDLDDNAIIALEKKVLRAVAKSARTVANQTIGDLRQAALDEGDEREDADRFSMWVSVLDDKTCNGCFDRHGLIFAADMWDGNAPRDGATECTGNCRCLLVPVANPGEGNEGKYVTRPTD